MNVFISPWAFLIWSIASWVIGMLGRHTRFGFAGNFLISFVFSPLVGLIVLLASDHSARVAKTTQRNRTT